MIVLAKEPPDVDRARQPARARRLPVREGRLGLQPDLRRHLRRLHRPHQLPAVLLPRPVRRHQGAGRPAHDAGRLHGRGDARRRRLAVRPLGRRQHADAWCCWSWPSALAAAALADRLAGADHAAADRLLRGAGRGQRRAVPAGAAALAADHRGGRLDDRRDRRARRRPGAQRDGPVAPIPGHLCLGLRRLRGAARWPCWCCCARCRPLDEHLGRRGRPRARARRRGRATPSRASRTSSPTRSDARADLPSTKDSP